MTLTISLFLSYKKFQMTNCRSNKLQEVIYNSLFFSLIDILKLI